MKQVYVIGISLLTVALWCANSWLQRWTGEMGIIAILPLVAFFGFGILGKVKLLGLFFASQVLKFLDDSPLCLYFTCYEAHRESKLLA